MVVGFARDQLHLTEEELSRIALNVREGDISVLLREYEKEIKVIVMFINIQTKNADS
jgi:nuclear-control-of-ATPase protein 2